MLSRVFVFLAVAVLATLVSSSETLVAHRQPRSPTRPITLSHIHRRLWEISQQKRDETFSNSTSLDKSFSGVTLFKFGTVVAKNFTKDAQDDKASEDAKNDKDQKADKDEEPKQSLEASAGIEIVCSRCYTKGKATATLTLEDKFNATLAYNEVKDTVSDTIDQIEDWIDDIHVNFKDLELDIPAPNITFDVDLAAFPGAVLEFQFDGVEMFVELDIILGAGLSYRLSLYKSHELGIELAEDLFLGLVFSVDLLLSVDSEVTITSGFHLLLDDGIMLRLALFAKDFANKTSDINFNGGKFEFLPVTVQAAGAVLRGVIQLSLRSGFSFSSPDLTPGFNIGIGEFDLDEATTATAGIEARVYANVAELVTNVTANTADDAECALNVVQEYKFAVGIAAGATAGVGGHVWGPVGATELALFATTLASACAIDGPKPTPSAKLLARAPQNGDEELTTTTLERKETFSATVCASTGLADCPASLLTVQESIATETLVTSVPSGVKATFPESTQLEVLSTVEFGPNAKSMVSETPTPTPTPSTKPDEKDGEDKIEEIVNGKTGGVSNKLIIGLSAGLGVPFIIAVIAGLLLWRRRRSTTRYSPAATMVEQSEIEYTGASKPKQPTQEVHQVYDR